VLSRAMASVMVVRCQNLSGPEGVGQTCHNPLWGCPFGSELVHLDL